MMLRYLLAILLLMLSAQFARAQPIVADLSEHLIAVTTGFSGTELLLFGAIEDGGDVVVVIRGPAEDLTVRKKERVAGVWINRDALEFNDVPAFYSVAASADIANIAPEGVRSRNQIGVNSLVLTPKSGVEDTYLGYRTALIRNKVAAGLYSGEPGKISFIGKRLFRTDVVFPSNVPTGFYTITVYLIKDGMIQSAQSTPLEVSKVGLGAQVYRFAHEYSAIYGILAIIVALFAGWAAGVIFKRP